MTRIAREVVPGWPHHVTQRGNQRQTVFFSDSERQLYMQLLIKSLREYEVKLVGYCLMGNHFHLVPVPETKEALSNAVGQPSNKYAIWHNLQHDHTGHLWQSRFFSTPVEPESVWEVLAYVELNPVRANLTPHPEQWGWSSASAHVTGMDPTGVLDMRWWEDRFTPLSWREFLSAQLSDNDRIREIRAATQAGRPIAGAEKLEWLEKALGRRLRPRGRPKG